MVKVDLDPQKFKLEKNQDGKYVVSGSVSKEEVFLYWCLNFHSILHFELLEEANTYSQAP